MARTANASPDEAPEPVPTGYTTTVVRLPPEIGAHGGEPLHPLLVAQVRDLQLRAGGNAPELEELLRLISAHYARLDEERRGIVRSMQLIADEVRSEARSERSNHLQTLLDSIKESVLMLDERGRILSFNLTAERVFGYAEAEALGRHIEELLPQLADPGPPQQALERLAASTGDTALDLAALEVQGRREDGEVFPAEVTVSRAHRSGKAIFVLCLRDISARKRGERWTAAEREALDRLAAGAPLAAVLESITRLMESVDPGFACSVSLLAADATAFSSVIAPALDEGLRSALERVPIDVRHGSCAAAVYLGRPVLVADLGKDPFWAALRQQTAGTALHAAWAMPLKAADGRVLGALGVYRRECGLPTEAEAAAIGRAAQLAGIAVERLLAEEALRGSEARFRGLFEGIQEGVFRTAPGGRLQEANPALAAMLGYADVQELFALRDFGEVYWDPAERSGVRHRLRREGRVSGLELRLRRADGSPLEVLMSGRVVREGGRVVGYEGTLLDITARKRAEQAVLAEKERAQVTLQSIGDGVISTNAAGLVDYLNPVAEKLTCWTLEEARGRPVEEVLRLIDDATRLPLTTAPSRASPTGPAGHPVLVTRGGQEVPVQETVAPIHDRGGRCIGTVIVIHDVTQERRLKRALAYQASHDALTGLINRREFDVRLRDVLSAAKRDGVRSALLYVDLDQFKVVNDTCGHDAGDRLMRDITAVLRSRVRAHDTIARLGGDEFGILLGECTLDQAAAVAELVRTAIQNYRFLWNSGAMSVGASIGVVEINADTANAAAAMTAADIACYAAKEEGRNRIHVYDDRGSGNHHRQMHWAARVTRAVEEDRLELFYQPIVPVGGGPLAFHEVTVQLRDEDGRLVPAGEFIPAAERYNVMPSVDRWVLLRTIEALRRRSGDGAAPTLAVNISGTSLSDQSFLDFVVQHAGGADVARRLCFEITETAAVTNWSAALTFMKDLQVRGCRFSLDDFGSGLSSFSYLRTLPVNFLKIDGQFVRQIAANAIDRSLVEAICRIGRSLGILTVAECVEDAATLAELKNVGADFAQGYHLARPRPLAELA